MRSSSLDRLKVALNWDQRPSAVAAIDLGYGVHLAVITRMEGLPRPFWRNKAEFGPGAQRGFSEEHGHLDLWNRWRLAEYPKRLAPRMDLQDHYRRVARGLELQARWRSRTQNKSGVHDTRNVVRLRS